MVEEVRRDCAHHWTHGLIVRLGLRAGQVVFRGQAVRPDFERSRLPDVAVVEVDSLGCVDLRAHEDVTVAFAPVVEAEGDVGAEDGASLPKQILEILPAYSVRQLRREIRGDRRSKDAVLTLPTKRCVRPSLPDAPTPAPGVFKGEFLSSVAAASVEAVALWMTCSISTSVIPLCVFRKRWNLLEIATHLQPEFIRHRHGP